MPPIDTPLNKAHQHASNAEEYINQGLLIPAAEEHHKSAEAFLLCVEQASDEGTKRTLRMLYNEHSKSGKEVQKKIAKLREEGKDPTLPQVPLAPALPSRTYSPTSAGAPAASSSTLNPRGRPSESNNLIDESYMVLGQQSDQTFNEFWKVFEGMLDKLSQPVAFATAPLIGSESARMARTQSRTLDSSPSNLSEKCAQAPTGNSTTPNTRESGQQCKTFTSTHIQEEPEYTFAIPNISDDSDLEEVLADPDSPSGESFFMIASSPGPSINKLKKENTSLRSEIQCLRQRLDVAERMRVEQEQQIREGISQARREAQRVMNSTLLPQRVLQSHADLSALNINNNPPPLTMTSAVGADDREVQLLRKVKELEEEVRTVHSENEKQRAMIVKFRERWEKLKESAKRKRNAKLTAGLGSVRDQRIDEEAEAEAEAERAEIG